VPGHCAVPAWRFAQEGLPYRRILGAKAGFDRVIRCPTVVGQQTRNLVLPHPNGSPLDPAPNCDAFSDAVFVTEQINLLRA
jgi:hypothetical protein